jgi:hypothetical protein
MGLQVELHRGATGIDGGEVTSRQAAGTEGQDAGNAGGGAAAPRAGAGVLEL